MAAEVVEQGLGFVGPSVRLISYSKWSGNTFSGFPGTETNIIIQYVHCSGWMTMENMVFMEGTKCWNIVMTNYYTNSKYWKCCEKLLHEFKVLDILLKIIAILYNVALAINLTQPVITAINPVIWLQLWFISLLLLECYMCTRVNEFDN